MELVSENRRVPMIMIPGLHLRQGSSFTRGTFKLLGSSLEEQTGPKRIAAQVSERSPRLRACFVTAQAIAHPVTDSKYCVRIKAFIRCSTGGKHILQIPRSLADVRALL